MRSRVEVKILQPDSTFFKVLLGKGRKPDQTDNKAKGALAWQPWPLSLSLSLVVGISI